MENAVIGIDLGGTTTTIGVVNRSGKILWKETFLTQETKNVDGFLVRVSQTMTIAQKEVDFMALGLGVGAPGANHQTGLLFSANLGWGSGTNLKERLEKQFSLPIAIDNDANTTAIGEMLFGTAQQLKHFILFTLGTGLGSGIVVNGNIVYGGDGFAGELGHICVDMSGRDCACGRKGCLETYASAPGLKRTVFELIAQRVTASPLRDLGFNQLTAKSISEAALAGDAIAIEAFEQTGKILGLKLADAVAHTSPDAIILFGGLANAGSLLFEPTQRYFKHFILPMYDRNIPILPSALPGSDAALLGAAALAWHHYEGDTPIKNY